MIKRVMVAGAPATGKSTLIGVWKNYLTKKKIPCRIIDDYKVLLSICPKISTSKKYYYNEDGAIILVDEFRGEVMEQQYQELEKLWQKDFEGVTILELANPKLEEAIKKHFSKVSNYSLVLVESGLDEVKKRNRLRDLWRRIPDEFIDQFSKINYKRGLVIENKTTLDDFNKLSLELAEKIFSE